MRWGLVATIKAEARAILDFAAYHVDAGAHRLFLYLDAPCPEVMPYLDAHTKIRVKLCDAAYWERDHGYRPKKHQVRQALNATRAYQRQSTGLDWLIHMDVDEFLTGPVSEALARLPVTSHAGRVRSVEALAGAEDAFKRNLIHRKNHRDIIARLYPEFGPFLKMGFISHHLGKSFVRPGLDGVTFSIHSARTSDGGRVEASDLPDLDLCHFHAADWDSWYGHYRYRLAKGSYRPDLNPMFSRDQGGMTLHELLSAIEAKDGEPGLRRFFEEICTDSPSMRDRLQQEDALVLHDLSRDAKRRKHFPNFG